MIAALRCDNQNSLWLLAFYTALITQHLDGKLFSCRQAQSLWKLLVNHGSSHHMCQKYFFFKKLKKTFHPWVEQFSSKISCSFFMLLKVCVCVFLWMCLHVCLWTRCVPATHRSQRRVRSPGSGMTDRCEPPMWVLGTHPVSSARVASYCS